MAGLEVYILFKFIYFCMCMNVLSGCRYVHPCLAMPRRSEEGVGFPWNWSSPGIGASDVSRPPGGFLGSNPGPL